MKGTRTVNSAGILRYGMLITVFITAGQAGLSAQEDSAAFAYAIDWEKSVLRIEAEAKLAPNNLVLPSARQKAEELIERRLLFAFTDAVSDMTVDSYYTVTEWTAEEPQLIEALNRLSRKYEKTFSKISTDLSTFSLTYTYSFFPDIVSMFIKHDTPYQPPRVLAHEPTAGFSGIIIHMKGEFPVHGERKTETLSPCLFPRIFDAEMNEIYEKGMVDPENLRTWGMAAYAEELDETLYRERIGYNPLKILGRGIFGKNYTDIIISKEAADKILYTAENRRLLKEGKVLIICELP